MTARRIMHAVLWLAIGAALGGGATWFLIEQWSDRGPADTAGATQPPEGRAESDDHGTVEVSDDWIERFEIGLAQAGPGELVIEVALPGEVQINPDAAAHVAPVVSGVARDVFKGLGDEVTAGELLAVLESRELAEAKADFLAANELLRLAVANFEREQQLREKKISTEKEFLEARQAEARARIDLDLAEQRLHALGVTQAEIEGLEDLEREARLTRYELRAPFDGIVTEKHIARGEKLSGDATPFVIADLDTVWVHLTVYQKDLGSVRVGHEAAIAVGHGIPDATGTIDYISPVVDEATRSATARVVLPNPDGVWRPGLFVTGTVVVDRSSAPLVVPSSAVLSVDDHPAVFVRTDAGFELRHVEVGRADAARTEIRDGLEPGETYVSKGAFTIKAELSKKAFAHTGHGH